MGKTLTIHNLDESVEEKLRQRAALRGRTPEAEARAILTREISADQAPDTKNESNPCDDEVQRDAPMPGGNINHLIGIWEGRGTTAELMRETRGED